MGTSQEKTQDSGAPEDRKEKLKNHLRKHWRKYAIGTAAAAGLGGYMWWQSPAEEQNNSPTPSHAEFNWVAMQHKSEKACPFQIIEDPPPQEQETYESDGPDVGFVDAMGTGDIEAAPMGPEQIACIVATSKFVQLMRNDRFDLKSIIKTQTGDDTFRVSGRTNDGVRVTTNMGANDWNTMLAAQEEKMEPVWYHQTDPQIPGGSGGGNTGGGGSTLMMLLVGIIGASVIFQIWNSIKQRRMMQNGDANPFGKMGKSPLKLEKQSPVRFSDIAGAHEAKDKARRIVEYIKNPEKYQRLGSEISRGTLLVGAPGNGKTLLAKAIAGESGVNFFYTSGAEFTEMLKGVGASRVRNMFEEARKNAPCIVFIDEIDALVKSRGNPMGDGDDQTLTQLLAEMDGIADNEGVYFIAATNRPDIMDEAAKRSGRFGHQIEVPSPNLLEREEVIRLYMKKHPLAPGIDPRAIAKGTPGFSCSDLRQLMNDAGLIAADKDHNVITKEDIYEAKYQVMIGERRQSMVVTEDERRNTAYHEAGHALIGIFHDPPYYDLHGVTILPRGRAMGVTINHPDTDRPMRDFGKMEAYLAMLTGGRIAEEMIFDRKEVTFGAYGDIQMATDQIRKMVMTMGYDEDLGFMSYNEQPQTIIGHKSGGATLSDETRREIEAACRKHLKAAKERGEKILHEHRGKLELLAKALLKFEELNGEEVMQVINGEEISRPGFDDVSDEFTGDPEPPPKRGSVPSAGNINPAGLSGPSASLSM